METEEMKVLNVTEIELVYKHPVAPEKRPKISTAESAYQLLIRCWDPKTIELQEQFKIILLNQASRVLGIYSATTGGITNVLTDPRLIFAVALKAAATGIILAHNHPTSETKPSAADIQLTKRLKDIGILLDISVTDHIIIVRNGYYSFSSEGLL